MIVDGAFNIQNIQISNGNSLKYSMDIELWNKKFICRIDWQICWGGPDMFSNSLYTGIIIGRCFLHWYIT